VTRPAQPDLLICAGLDPSGGAGLIADVRIASELGARPIGVVTALTVQSTLGVIGCHACDPEVVSHQLSYLLGDIEARAVKIGMIGSAAIVREIARALEQTRAPVVWDPVLASSRGGVDLAGGSLGDAALAFRPHLALVTPNARELAAMTDLPVATLAEAEAAAKELALRLDCAVLAKGGHLGGDEAVDLLIEQTGVTALRGPRVPDGENVHGTGCALSTAIAAYLALGTPLAEACSLAKQLVACKIAAPVRPGRGAPAII